APQCGWHPHAGALLRCALDLRLQRGVHCREAFLRLGEGAAEETHEDTTQGLGLDEPSAPVRERLELEAVLAVEKAGHQEAPDPAEPACRLERGVWPADTPLP